MGFVVEEQLVGAGVDAGELEDHAVAVGGGGDGVGEGGGESRADQVEVVCLGD